MQPELRRGPSHWLMRVMEWNDPKARYPNIWHAGMPIHILALDMMAGRLRLGDLIAIYHPASLRHRDRSNRVVGIATVTGLRRADAPNQAWIDLETAHRFDPPLELPTPPQRGLACCDPEWKSPEVELFRLIRDRAIAAGWGPPPELPPTRVGAGPAPSPDPAGSENADEAPCEPSSSEPVEAEPSLPEPVEAEPSSPGPIEAGNESPVQSRIGVDADARLFAGADVSGDMRDPRNGTWLAVVALVEDRLQVVRLDAKGRTGLQNSLRDPDRDLMRAEAIGLGFPFGLPERFARSLMGHDFPEEGWWALAKQLEKLTWPGYLRTLSEFRGDEGELKRLTDEKLEGCSPLQRDDPDMGSKGFHGIRMIAEDRSRFAIRPFENAQGKLLLEVYPTGAVRSLLSGTGDEARSGRTSEVLEALPAQDRWPLDVVGRFRKDCRRARQALHAVLAARCAAVAVLSGEADRTPEDLAPGHGERIGREGWIYGLEPPA